jgi:hypothetical protein
MNKIPPYNIVCPSCGNKNAFEGFLHVQCPNENCLNYNFIQKADVEKWENEKIEEQKNKAAYSGETDSSDEDEYQEMNSTLRRIFATYGACKPAPINSVNPHTVYTDPSDTQTDNQVLSDDDDDDYGTVY